MAKEPLNKLVSVKTGAPVFLNDADTKTHMKLHGRKFRNDGPTTEYTPDEAKEEAASAAPKGSVRKATAATADVPGENVPQV